MDHYVKFYENPENRSQRSYYLEGGRKHFSAFSRSVLYIVVQNKRYSAAVVV